MLRQIELPPKASEDNYEISDRGEDSDAEEPDRSHKHVPAWSLEFLKLMEAQVKTDPDSIFSSKVPRCDLRIIFTDADYLKSKKDRHPKRKRGSSGEWRQDRLSKSEVLEYKRKMGHTKPWTRKDGKSS